MYEKPEIMWKKESTESDAFYVDIFNGVRSMEVYSAIYEANTQQKMVGFPKKDNRLALNYRNEGNQLYIRKDYKKAIEAYNKSLCYAEIGTEHVSFAFGNRSLCFFEEKNYKQCLMDIELAIDANYPENLMGKLEKRKANCLEQMKVEFPPNVLNEPKLSFDADNEIPGMANILKIEHNDKFGRHIVAESDIGVGQTVLIEKPLAAVLIESEYSRCSNCLKENKNFIACKKCINAMFCDENCANNPYHRYECSMYKLFIWEFDGYFRSMFQLIIRLVLIGVSLTSTMTIDELMQLVVDTNVTVGGSKEIIIAKDNIQSKYETLLKLSCFIPAEKSLFEASIQMACVAYDLLMECYEIRCLFSTVTHRRFLMHLTTQMSGIFKTNRFTLSDIHKFSVKPSFENFGLSIFNLRSFLNHACVPNIVCLSYDNVLVCKALCKIKKGEQLFIDYMKIDVDTEKTTRRQQILDVYGFSCDCQLCLLNSQTLPSNDLMKADSDFKFVDTRFTAAMKTRNENVLKELKEKSMQFLKKWGRMKPSRELLTIMQQYITVFLQVLKHDDV